MKIDSPTFLTETTFISSSVVFSSGSQKFGDSSDDIQQFTGSISVTETGSFGKLTIGTGDVFTDVSSSVASFLTIDTKAGNYATASAIWIKGTSHLNKLRINFDNKSSGTPYSAIEGTTQGGGADRGELRFYTRNTTGTTLNPRLLIANDGAVAFYQAYGSGDPLRSTTFTSASLAVFGSNTNFQKPWAIFAENRSSNAGRGGLFISAHADNSEEPIIRAANNYNDGTVFEVTANGTQHKVSGSSTSTGSFGNVHVASKLAIQNTNPRGPIDVLGSNGSQGF